MSPVAVVCHVTSVPRPTAGPHRSSDCITGRRPGTTTEDASTIKELQQEVRELKRANEMEGVA
jgi:hypothetical protein